MPIKTHQMLCLIGSLPCCLLLLQLLLCTRQVMPEQVTQSFCFLPAVWAAHTEAQLSILRWTSAKSKSDQFHADLKNHCTFFLPFSQRHTLQDSLLAI